MLTIVFGNNYGLVSDLFDCSLNKFICRSQFAIFTKYDSKIVFNGMISVVYFGAVKKSKVSDMNTLVDSL